MDIILQELLGIGDIVKIEIYDLDGKLIDFVVIKNKITTVNLNMLRDVYRGTVTDGKIKYLAWGSDNTAVSAAHTTLVAEFGRKAITSQAAGAAGVVTTTTYVAPYEANAPKVEELGWFAGVDATGTVDTGIMVGRILYSRDKTAIESWNVVRTDTFTEV